MLPAEAKSRIGHWDYIEMVNLDVNGKTYEVPVGNKDRKETLYLLKKALHGDKEARDMIIGSKGQAMIYIGKDTPLWLKVTKNSEEVIVP